MSNTIAVDETLDTSGLLCPLPVYKAGLILNRLEAGKVLHLITTDPGSLEDIPALARQRGDQLLDLENLGTSQEFWLKKGPIAEASTKGTTT